MVKKKLQIKFLSLSRSKYFWPGVIAVFAFLLYSNTLQHDYAQDDAIVIYDNMFTVQGVKGIPSLFQYDTFYGFFKVEGKDKLVSGGRYRPLSLVTFAVEWEIFGRNPQIGHLINIILYGMTAWILYFTILGLPIKGLQQQKNLAILATVLFVVHPIHTEVVANIKGRDEILSFLFAIISLYSVFRFISKEGKIWAFLGSLSLFLACLSKENAISFGFIIPFAAWFFGKPKLSRILPVVFIPMAGIGLYLILRFAVLGFDLGSTSTELMNNPFIKIEEGIYSVFSFSEKWATIIFILGKYVQLLFFPHPLSHDYYPRQIEIMSFSNPEVWLSIIIYLSMIAFFFYSYKRKNLTGFAIIYYLASLVLVSNILFPIGTNLSERFLYMPSLGFALWLGFAFLTFFQTKWRQAALAFFLLTCALFSIKTMDRNMVWKDNFTLFNSDVKTSPNSAKLQNAAGGSLAHVAATEKNKEKKEKMLLQAIEHLEKALYIHPKYKSPYLILGNCYHMLEKYNQASQYYQSALSLDPDFREASINNAINDRELGRYYGSKIGDLDKSLSYLQRAEAILSDDYETFRLLGIAYGYKGQPGLAVQYFEKALALNPGSAAAHVNLGKAYGNAGNKEKSDELFRKAIQIDPNAMD